MFRFTISDLGNFLGKSPVTIRAWERKGLITLPRVGANRCLGVEDVYEVADTAHRAGRISAERRLLIADAITCLRSIEWENE